MNRFWKSGDPFIWLTGAALGLSLVMVAGLGFFWPADVVRLSLTDGTIVMGQITERERIPQPGAPPGTPERYRIQRKVGNRDLYGADFLWVDEDRITRRETPPDVVLIQRREWGMLLGVIREVREAGRVVSEGPEAGWAALQARLPQAHVTVAAIREIEKQEIGTINYRQERIRLALRRLELQGITGGPEVDRLTQEMVSWQARSQEQEAALSALRKRETASVVAAAAGDQEKDLPLSHVVRATQPNRLGLPA